MVRDTGDDWKLIGETEPWYGVLAAPEFLKANLTEETRERFYKQGQDEIGKVVEDLGRYFPGFAPKTGIDFGSGLGRLSFPMAAVCDEVYGVDISPGMIAEAERQAQLRGVTNVTFGHALPGEVRADWINSYVVFQHITPRVGYSILNDLLSRLRLGGHTSIHLTFAHDFRDVNAITRDVYAYRYDGETTTTLECLTTQIGDMSMYDYDFNKVLFSFVRNGVVNPVLHHTDHGGAHGFWIYGRKDR